MTFFFCLRHPRWISVHVFSARFDCVLILHLSVLSVSPLAFPWHTTSVIFHCNFSVSNVHLQLFFFIGVGLHWGYAFFYILCKWSVQHLFIYDLVIIIVVGGFELFFFLSFTVLYNLFRVSINPECPLCCCCLFFCRYALLRSYHPKCSTLFSVKGSGYLRN